MAQNLDRQTLEKQRVGYAAVDKYVHSNSIVGLGTGSTAYWVVDRLGQKLKSGELVNVKGIPTSEATREQAEGLGIPLTSLNELTGIPLGKDETKLDPRPYPADKQVITEIDVAIDGADEVDIKRGIFLKGRGGALLREKQVAFSSKQFVCVVDSTKLFDSLGLSGTCPVEINQYGYLHTQMKIEQLFDSAVLEGSQVRRLKGECKLFVTDNGNYVVDLIFRKDAKLDILDLNEKILAIPGVVETGFFIGLKNPQVVYAEGEEVRMLGTGKEIQA